ncbi:hypothetical protein AYI70_g3318 [Smittium culicis]|uniref:Uncharacterized protein n=1 Tax=Smittium culicis TaxID=133412 RepID=A0A1R1Y4J4_9FUNG|nr:hypothetical protein AYI70_g3318 [Smittium culicis]
MQHHIVYNENNDKKVSYEKSESVRKSTVKLPYVPGKSLEDSESVKSNLNGSDIRLTAERKISLTAEPEIKLTAEPKVKPIAEHGIGLTAKPEIKHAVTPRINFSLESAIIPTVEFILDSNDDVENSSSVKIDASVNPPRPAFQYSKAIETKKPKEKVKLNLTAALACKTFTPYEYSKKVSTRGFDGKAGPLRESVLYRDCQGYQTTTIQSCEGILDRLKNLDRKGREYSVCWRQNSIPC